MTNIFYAEGLKKMRRADLHFQLVDRNKNNIQLID